jgi:hypothetical protein
MFAICSPCLKLILLLKTLVVISRQLADRLFVMMFNQRVEAEQPLYRPLLKPENRIPNFNIGHETVSAGNHPILFCGQS